jgi:hypothetical protein
MISRFDGADAIANAHDFAGTVGHRNAAVGGLDHPGDDGEVVKIQRAGIHPNQDLPGSGERFGTAFDDDPIEPAWGVNAGNLHGMFFSGPWNSVAIRPAFVRLWLSAIIPPNHQMSYLACRRGRRRDEPETTWRRLKKQPRMMAMAAKIKRSGYRSRYRLRKQVVEPVFGQIKHARGFRQLLLRGLDKVRCEWALVCTAHNLLKLAGSR